MLQQALDFQAESDALLDLLAPLADADFAQPTQFKGWTIDHVLQHLHLFNRWAWLSLTDEAAFMRELNALMTALRDGETLLPYTDRAVGGLTGQALLAAWRETYTAMLADFHAADPKQRVRWAGPEMSVLSSITARLMETWAHGQEVYDLLGVERVETDRIRNVVVIGNNTFGWSFRNRGLSVPEPRPHLRLAAPSGALWAFNDPSDSELIEGPAAAFCQVVTQTRNIADTGLKVVGPVAAQWMAIAQCFAGEPQDPPAPGTRFTRR